MTNKNYGKIKKEVIVRLQEKHNSFELIKKRFLLPNVTEKINLNEFKLHQNHLDIILSNKDETKSIVLNRTYHKHIDELSKDYKIEISQRKELKLNVSNSFIKSIKSFFNKSDITELKTIAK